MLFSIIIPTYNRGYCIENTINSILYQEFSDYEIIIIDDGSTDNTHLLVQKFISKTHVIKYHKLLENRGVNYAKNYGAKISEGRWLIFLDSDDKFADNALKTIFNMIFALEEKVDLFFFSCKSISGRLLSNNPSFEGIIAYKDYFRGAVKGEYLPVVKSTVFKGFFFNEKLNGGERLTWNKISKNCKVYICGKQVRIYNDIAVDRLSFKTHSFFSRIIEIYVCDLKENMSDYIKYNKRGLMINVVKLIYYKIVNLISFS